MSNRPQQIASRPDHGAALVLVLIFSVLLYIVISQLVTTAKMARLAGGNDALLAQMDNHVSAVTLPQVYQQLKDDLADASGEGEGEGGAGAGAGAAGLLGNAAAGAGTGTGAGGLGGEGEEEEEPPSDSSRDAWYLPKAYSNGDITTYVWVEDENRKLNLLALMSPDEEFAALTRDRLIRLVDGLRADTDFDVTQGDATVIADAILSWMRGENRNEDFLPRPVLKTDEDGEDRTLPLHLDELMLLEGVTAELFYDKVIADDRGEPRVLLGLESVLTIYTSWATDPGDPEKQQANNIRNGIQGNNRTPTTGSNTNTGNNNNRNAGNNNSPPDPNQGEDGAAEPAGQGIRININTVSRQVLRCMFTVAEMPDNVIDAILKYRNEEAEEDEESEEGEEEDYADDVREGESVRRKIFTALEDLDEVPEFKNLPDPKMKQRFLDALTVNSDVFSIHMASMYKRNEERRVYVLSRRRSVVVRMEGDEEPVLHPIIHLERRQGLRIFPIDFPEEERERQQELQIDMDEFSAEERKWNPFYVEFYRKRDPNETR